MLFMDNLSSRCDNLISIVKISQGWSLMVGKLETCFQIFISFCRCCWEYPYESAKRRHVFTIIRNYSIYKYITLGYNIKGEKESCMKTPITIKFCLTVLQFSVKNKFDIQVIIYFFPDLFKNIYASTFSVI